MTKRDTTFKIFIRTYLKLVLYFTRIAVKQNNAYAKYIFADSA